MSGTNGQLAHNRAEQSMGRSHRAIEQAHGLLTRLQLLVRAVCDGGQVSALHLTAMGDDVLVLLEEVGGFDEVVRCYTAVREGRKS